MPGFLQKSAFLPIIFCIALAGCAATPDDRNGPVSAIEQEHPSATSGAPCPRPKPDRTYVEPCMSAISRDLDTPIRDVPGSVQIINRDVIDDQRALTVGDALRNVSGVQGGGR